MLTKLQFRRIYRISAIYDLIVISAFATPWTFLLLMGLIKQFAEGMNIPGQIIEPDVFHILFANMVGTVVLVWSFTRLKLDLPILGRYDAAGRYLFSGWMIYALAHGASQIIVGLLVIEICFGIAQSLPVRK